MVMRQLDEQGAEYNALQLKVADFLKLMEECGDAADDDLGKMRIIDDHQDQGWRRNRLNEQSHTVKQSTTNLTGTKTIYDSATCQVQRGNHVRSRPDSCRPVKVFKIAVKCTPAFLVRARTCLNESLAPTRTLAPAKA